MQRLRQHGVKLSVSGLRLYERGEGASEEKTAQILAVLTGTSATRASIGSLLPRGAVELLAKATEATVNGQPRERIMLMLYAFTSKFDSTDPEEKALLEQILKLLEEPGDFPEDDD